MAQQTSSPRSGRINVRLPVALHAALAAEAERQCVSLNTLIVTLLAGGIGWRSERGG
jgi:predicted HicB family RNase H-like nuclease